MKLGIIVSKRLEEKFKLKVREFLIKKDISFIEIDKLPHYLTDDDLNESDADYFIIIGIHSVDDKLKQFSVHPLGNWNKRWPFALYGEKGLGGEEKKLSVSSGCLLKEVYLSLLKNNTLDDYKVNIEATHHGPLLSRPVVFLEIGSSSEEWEDEKANEIIANVIDDVKKKSDLNQNKSVIMIGGNHYMTKAVEILRRTNLQISHMLPSYHVGNFNEESLKEAIDKTKEKVDCVIIDLAEVGQHKDKIIEVVKKAGLSYRFMHNII